VCTQENRRGGGRFIALQGSYEVPFDVVEIGKAGPLAAGFLHVVLAEFALPERMDGSHRLGGNVLLTASRRTESGRAWRACAARAIRERTACHGFS
jgi:hypothetical protein